MSEQSNTKLFGIELSKKKKQAAQGATPQPPKSSKKNAPRQEEGINKHFQPGAPGVNILPAYVYTRYEAQGTRKRFVAVAIILAGVLLLGFIAKFFVSYGYQGELDRLEQESAQISLRISELRPYQAYSDQVEAKRATLSEQVSGTIDNAAVMNLVVSFADDADVTLDSVALSPSTPVGGVSEETSASGCPSPDPFSESPGIACIAFKGTAPSVAAAHQFSAIMLDDPNMLSAYVQNVVPTEEGDYTIEGSVVAASDLYSSRFEPLNLPLQSVITGETATEEESADATEGDN